MSWNVKLSKQHKQKLFILFVLSSITMPTFAFSWDDLWLRADQQGEKAMNAGNIKQAKKLFKNKSWKAVASYRSGDYQAALDNFKHEKTATAFYNQGNALAQMGEYDKAIDAYNQALAKNPKLTDAAYNKQLLEKIKKQQNENKSQSNQSKNNNADSKKQQSNKNKQSQNQSQNQSQKNAQDSNNQQQNNKTTQQQQSSSSKQNTKQQDNGSTAKNITPTEQSKNTSQKSKPIDEQKQATEQWLRGIPDDPGGLLRQKFLRDHQQYQAAHE